MHGKFSFLFKNQLGIVEEEDKRGKEGDGVLFSLSRGLSLDCLIYFI